MTRVSSPPPSPSPRRVLIAFDFDDSFVDADSDLFVLQSLCPELLAEIVAAGITHVPDEGYSQLSDDVFRLLHDRAPSITREALLDTAARVPVSPQILDAVKRAVTDFNAMVVIISDANELFIRALLAHHGMEAFVSQIYSNGAHWTSAESTRLRITPHVSLSAEPHGCKRCPRNLCKGRVLETIRAQHAVEAVLYVGDGANDYCPATRLTSRDAVFARADAVPDRSFQLLKKIQHAPDAITARVVPWATGDELHDGLLQALKAATVSDIAA